MNDVLQVVLLYLLWFASCALIYPHFIFLPNAIKSVDAASRSSLFDIFAYDPRRSFHFLD